MVDMPGKEVYRYLNPLKLDKPKCSLSFAIKCIKQKVLNQTHSIKVIVIGNFCHI